MEKELGRENKLVESIGFLSVSSDKSKCIDDLKSFVFSKIDF